MAMTAMQAISRTRNHTGTHGLLIRRNCPASTRAIGVEIAYPATPATTVRSSPKRMPSSRRGTTISSTAAPTIVAATAMP